MKLAVFLVGRWRLELQTNCLKGNCSTIELASHLLSFVKVNTILQKSFCKCKHFFQKIKIPAENAFPQGLFGFYCLFFVVVNNFKVRIDGSVFLGIACWRRRSRVGCACLLLCSGLLCGLHNCVKLCNLCVDCVER